MSDEDDVVLDLTTALEKNFAELKIGEDQFEKVKDYTKEVNHKKKDIIYQERYSSENHVEDIVVKPIAATKKTISKGIDVVDDIQEAVDEKQIPSPKPVILDSPTNSIGDDFSVDW